LNLRQASPKISVVMAVYNGETHLEAAVDSVLDQTFADFEFIIVDDGSTDNTPNILASYQDSRIAVVTQSNHGLPHALNTGIERARGIYIARMDDDDVCHNERFERQMKFMESHPNIDVCGSWVLARGGARKHLWRYPTEPDEIKCSLLFHTPLAHPSVMFRHAAFERERLRYDETFRYAQDYELWQRASLSLKIANLDEVLLEYQVGAWQGSGSREKQIPYIRRIQERAIRALGISPSDEDLMTHYHLAYLDMIPTKPFVVAADRWLRRLHAANISTLIYPRPAFERFLGKLWFNTCLCASRAGEKVIGLYFRSPLKRYTSFGSRARFAFKSIKWMM
jgi:glycosyltransferase involved in cell wall biosynthesis